jgi:hypothetical protein
LLEEASSYTATDNKNSQNSRKLLLANIKQQQITKIARIAGSFF